MSIWLIYLGVAASPLVTASPDSNPEIGIQLPHGSITFFGPNYGDTQSGNFQDRKLELQSPNPSPFYVTSSPNLATTPAPIFSSYSPVTTPSPRIIHSSSPTYLPYQFSPRTFFSPSPSPTKFDNTSPFNIFQNDKASPSQGISPFSFGPINSAVPFSQFNQNIKPTTQTNFRTPNFHHIVSKPPVTFFEFSPSFSSLKEVAQIDTTKLVPDISLGVKDSENVKSVKQTKLEDIQLKPISLDDTYETSVKQTRLEDIFGSDKEQSKSGTISKSLDKNYEKISFVGSGPNDITSESRKSRKIDFSAPSAKNITGLIKKALSLVKKVEEIDKRKKALTSTVGDRSSKSREQERSSSNIEKLRDLKDDERFNNLKSFIQDQTSISNLIRSENNELRDLFKSKTVTKDRDSSKNTKNMIKALSKLNSISSLLLKDNDKTKSTVRQLPDEIRNIVQSEVDGLKGILEEQNVAVASALRSAIRSEARSTSRASKTSDTEIVILKALAKLNKISGILLKEQEKTEEQTSTALKALPALAKFIQAETADIKEIIQDQAEENDNNEELAELKRDVSQSLANDKLITRAIIKLNDITQLLLRDVNFTTSAVTNKLPQALTALITSETRKIRKMIDVQNDAIVEILKDSENLARAEKVIEEARNIKQTLGGATSVGKIEGKQLVPASDKLSQILSPLLEIQSRENVLGDNDDSSRSEKLIAILDPLLKKQETESKEAEIQAQETSEKQNETEAILKAQLSGQKSIVQALLKLTNITRTLLDEKDTDDEFREEISNIRETDRNSGPKINKQNNIDRSKVKNSREKLSSIEEYDLYEEEYDYKELLPLRAKKGRESLVERIASSSAAGRALRGNQALFEEFVKLAIERQRWEQAQDVTNIIKASLTTEKPAKDDDEYEEEEYYYDESEEVEEIKERPRPKRPKEHSKTKNTGKGGKKKHTNRFRSDSKDFDRESEEEYYDLEEKQLPIRRPRPTRRPQKANRRPLRPTKTREPEPVYEEYDIEEDYPIYEDFEYEEEENISEEIDSLRSNTRPKSIQNQSKNRENFLQDNRQSVLRNSPTETVRSRRPSPSFSSRGKFIPTIRPKFLTSGNKGKEAKSSKQNSLSREITEPRTIPTSINTKPEVDQKKVEPEETGRPSIKDLNKPDQRLTSASLEQAVTDRQSNIEERPISAAKKINKIKGIVDKQKEAKANLLKSLLSKSKNRNIKLSSVSLRKESKGNGNKPSSVSLDEIKKDNGRQNEKDTKKIAPLVSLKEGNKDNGRHFRRGGKRKKKKKNNLHESTKKSSEELKSFKKPLQSSKTSPLDILQDIVRQKGSKSSIEKKNNNVKKDEITKTEPKEIIIPKTKEGTFKEKVQSKLVNEKSSSRLTSQLLSQIAQSSIRELNRPESDERESSRKRSEARESQKLLLEPKVSQNLHSVERESQRLHLGARESHKSRQSGRKSQKPQLDARELQKPQLLSKGSLPKKFKSTSESTPKNKLPTNSQVIAKKPKNSNSKEDTERESNLPLSEGEAKEKKAQRNNLLKALGRNRKQRPHHRKAPKTSSEKTFSTQSTKRELSIKDPQLSSQELSNKNHPQILSQERKMSPLEKLFNIASNNEKRGKDSSQTVVKLSTSSSSSSSKSPAAKSNRRKQGKKKKGSRLSLKNNPRPTENPGLKELSPQERLMKKVKDTLIINKSKPNEDSDNQNSRRQGGRKFKRPEENRKKVILRKKKPNRFGKGSREGRQLDGTSLKTVKIRVRRLHEEPDFPVVY